MKSLTMLIASIVLATVLVAVFADYHNQPLKIKHVWHDGHGYGHGYGHGKGHGYGHKQVGYSKSYHHQDHHHGN